MKKALIVSLAITALTAVSFMTPPNPLVGHWQQRWRSGAIMLVNFRSDSSYDAFVNGKAFTSGKYYVRQDTVGVSDGVCNMNYYGRYKMSFFAQDSLRWTVIDDTCGGRRRGTDKGTFGRVTSSK
jgi:hypothetical protein